MNTAGGNLPSADGAFERFLTAAIATIITIMFSWRLLTDVSDYDSAGCLLAAPPVGLKHLALNDRHESVDGDDDEDQSEEEEEGEKRGSRRKKKRTIYKTEKTDTVKNEHPSRLHTWGHNDGEDLLDYDYEACLRIVQQHENSIDQETNTSAGLKQPLKSTLNITGKKTNNNSVFITYGEQRDKPSDRTHTEAKKVANISCTGDASYLQFKPQGSTCASEGWLSDENETIIKTDSNPTNCSPLEVKKRSQFYSWGCSCDQN